MMKLKKKMILNTRVNENIDYKFKIPIDSFTFSEPKPYFKKSEKGLITFKYKPLKIDDISLNFDETNNNNNEEEIKEDDMN